MLWRRHWRAVLLLALLAGCAPAPGSAGQHQPAPGRAGQPAPSRSAPLPPLARIPVDALGFRPPGELYRLSRMSMLSLTFLGEDELLLTFRGAALLRRLPGEPPEDDDQMVEALVLRLPTGEVEQRAEWRLHDRARYLWPAGNGRAMVRIRDRLFLVDRTLELRPYLDSRQQILAIEQSPDRKVLAIQTRESPPPEDAIAAAAGGSEAGRDGARENVTLRILTAADLRLLAESHLPHAIHLPLYDQGFVTPLRGQAGQWLIEDDSYRGGRRQVAMVESSCMPAIHLLTEKVVLLLLCSSESYDRSGVALELSGKKLWDRRWDGHRVWPTLELAENGSRLAYSTLLVDHPVTALQPFEADQVRAQQVQVIDVESGREVLMTDASPVVDAGQNYALSPSGGRFAVLRAGAIEVYTLPPVE